MRPEGFQFPVAGWLYRSWIKVYGKFIFYTRKKVWSVRSEATSPLPTSLSTGNSPY
jgi:hypothetical protein